MKAFLLIFFFSVSLLFSASIYTLDNVSSLNLYIANETDFIDKKKLEQTLTDKLEKAGFVFGQTDALILVVKIKSLEIEESMAISISLGLGEEVKTKRKDEIETFSYTYLESKFIEGYEPNADTMEALNALVDDFIEAHKDDNEE